MLPSQRSLILFALIFGLLLLFYAFLSTSEIDSDQPVFGDLNLTEDAPQERQYTSNYKRINSEEKDKNNLRYKVQRSKENPLFSIYKKDKAAAPSKDITPSRANPRARANSQARAKPLARKKQSEFFNFTNEDMSGSTVFSAFFKEGQWVQPDKALSLILEEPIKSLNLQAGTVLKGIPTIQEGRIQIRITAGELGSIVRPLNLVCLDRDDCVSGLYHDVLSDRQQKSLKQGLLSELWSMTEPSGRTNKEEQTSSNNEALRKGRRIASRIADNWETGDNIFIKSGRKVLVMIPKE